MKFLTLLADVNAGGAELADSWDALAPLDVPMIPFIAKRLARAMSTDDLKWLRMEHFCTSTVDFCIAHLGAEGVSFIENTCGHMIQKLLVSVAATGKGAEKAHTQ